MRSAVTHPTRKQKDARSDHAAYSSNPGRPQDCTARLGYNRRPLARPPQSDQRRSDERGRGDWRDYQELATKNAKNLTAAMQALAAVKSPTEFIELQQRLIKEGVEAAVSDSRHIAQLTTAVFTAAFEPVKKQLEKTART